ncbi:bifunctional 2-polyprenyl-6-hydroxyphenol methylase/3-demethylubiquinol 3-O-methyltransferase UbiG [Streptomyces sp. WMMB 322]|uniref:class I SAM-dependent methyltransferase n=1 Tax=Streptomyces sp. WMMB 322 TaxID=1286821 RepID=UPI0006E35302|nr:class I SAM-dependent methyltransferase [Streptomyces sp. WMMB 322]SCK10051.1 Ubiquinone/menaquinone biosynthesis C-methylase UbiE [Streptomyces sp. WMMB 322]
MTHADRTSHPDAPVLAAEITAYYERGGEYNRLREGDGRLEFWRTQDVLRRLLPPAPARILDVGGGSGIHAEWLAADGYRVDLVDPVPSHVEQAAGIPRVRAHVGDARSLDVPEGTAEVVLLLGPLYHLTARRERVAALAEAHRVLIPGGLVVAATINRFAGIHDTLNKGAYFDPGLRPQIEAAAHDGRLRAAEGEKSMFTTAYFHQPEEVPAEFTAAGLTPTGQYGLEGAAWLMGGLASWLDDPGRRELVLHAMRRTESVPSLLGVSGHVLTAGRKQDDAPDAAGS